MLSCHVAVWADVDTWLERQEQEREMERLRAEEREAARLAGGQKVVDMTTRTLTFAERSRYKAAYSPSCVLGSNLGWTRWRSSWSMLTLAFMIQYDKL
jgi:hypothetical protein